MTDYRRYDEIEVGEAIPAVPTSFTVSRDVVERFVAAAGGAPAPAAGERAPSMIAAVYLIELLNARRSPPGGIHARQRLKFHRTVRVGETLSNQATVTEKYVRKGRSYVVLELEACGEDGSLVSSGGVTSIWGRDDD